MAIKGAVRGQLNFKRLMDLAPDAIIIYNSDNTFAYANPAASRLLGFTRKDILTKTVDQFLQPTQKARLEIVKEERRRGDDRLVEWQAVHRNGSLIEIEAKSVYLPETGQWLSFLRDIGDRKRMQAQIHDAVVKEQVLEAKAGLLEKQRQQLLALNKAKDEFIMLASHQLRTPATAVKQYIGMLKSGYFGQMTPEQKEMLGTAYEANERQMHVVNNMLLTAEFEAGQALVLRQAQDLVRCIKDVVAEALPTLKEKRQIIDLKLPRSCRAFCDTNMLQVALRHVLNNASQYSEAGKSIGIRLVRNRKYAIISITDQGVGIRKKDHKLLFQKFTRIPNILTDTVNGNGLGLYLSKLIVDAHQGQISLDSYFKRGSTFTMRIPVKAV